MTISNSFYFRRGAQLLRPASVLILAGCALWLGLRVPVNYARTVYPANTLPDLRGREAVERLKQDGLFDMAAEAIGPPFTEEAKLTAGPYQYDDSFGASIAISGDTIAVTEPESYFTLGMGAAHIFARSGTTWTRQQILTPSDAEAYDHFGASIAISGDTVVVGMPWGGEGKLGIGRAYIFVRSGATWSEQQILTASDGAIYDYFGASVAISGDTMVVGGGGGAYIFARNGTTWSERQKLTASDGGGYFGGSVAISGDMVVAGGGGAAYIFVRCGTTWAQQQKLMASDGAVGATFGSSVAISGDTVVVGAASYSYLEPKQGAAYVFTRSGTTWSEKQKLTASDGKFHDYFGSSVAISGNTVVVGAFLADVGGNADRGAAYVFARSGTTWTQQQKLAASDGEYFDWFGASVAISPDRILVGAIGDDYFSGSVYVFAP